MPNDAPHPHARHVEILKSLLDADSPKEILGSTWELRDRLAMEELLNDGLVSGIFRRDTMGQPSDFANLVITTAGRRFVLDHEQQVASGGDSVKSVGQSGGITAHTVNITHAPQAVGMAPASTRKKPWYQLTWVILSGAVAFVAGVLKILDHFNIRFW